jgi:7-keto-8-aminopelargonate synthetase-like enzyme
VAATVQVHQDRALAVQRAEHNVRAGADVSERLIQECVVEDRERCRALVEMLIDEPAFLVYCIMAPVFPGEDIAFHRKRFVELQPVAETDDIEDLM